MIDLHAHILYGIDDGAKSIDDAMKMINMAVNSGTRDIVATPHVNRQGIIPQWQDIIEKVAVLQFETKKRNISINIYSGAEIELNYDALKLIKNGCFDYCLADSRYILVEPTEQSQPKQFEKLLYEIMLRGFIPVLAHPERCERIMMHAEIVLEWMKQGVLIQCNIGSFAGKFGKNIQKRAEKLLYNKMVTFLGSDAHNLVSRNTDMHEIFSKLGNKEKGMLVVCEDNARKVLQNEVLYPKLPECIKKKLWQKIF